MIRNTKRIPAFILSLALAFVLAGCGNTRSNNGDGAARQAAENTQSEIVQESAAADTSEEKSQDAAVPAESETDSMEAEDTSGSDTLVVYFSREGEQYNVGVIDKGNTEIVAEMIADATGADLYEVVPADDNYPTTYDELTDVAKKEQNENARPAYADTVPDLSGYSRIFIGAPVWWGDWPMLMYTFFENEDLSGKTLIPFSTHEGSGLSGFDNKLSSACPKAEVQSGLAIRGSDAQNNQDNVRASVNDWLSGLGY